MGWMVSCTAHGRCKSDQIRFATPHHLTSAGCGPRISDFLSGGWNHSAQDHGAGVAPPPPNARREPFTYHTKAGTHAARPAMTPRTPTPTHSSCAPRAVSRLILWRRLDEQHGPRSSSIFVRAGGKPWPGLEGPPPPPPAESEPIYGVRDRFFSSQPRRTGSPGGGGTVPITLLMTLM